MQKYLPWYLKIAIKTVLARLPVPYGFWSRLGLFKHGGMSTVPYAKKIFSVHQAIADKFNIPTDGTYLEMGTGDSVVTALMAASRGAQKIYLVDAGDFATRDMGFYRAFAKMLRDEENSKLPPIPEDMSFEQMLRICNAEYLTEGTNSLAAIPDNSVDFIWSHATLEHVRKHEFSKTMEENYRILKPGGIASHNIDLKDHLGGALNNLRFDEKTWESDWMVKSGFYTNRLRYSQIVKIFEESGFIFEEKNAGRWDAVPTERNKMNAAFRGLDDEDLKVRGMSVALRKPFEFSNIRAAAY
jgi:SAM-dependent methyltransferase